MTIDFIAPTTALHCLGYGIPFRTKEASDSVFLFHRSIALVQRHRIADAVSNVSALYYDANAVANASTLYDDGNAIANNGLRQILDILAPTLPKVNAYISYENPAVIKSNLGWIIGFVLSTTTAVAAIGYIFIAKNKHHKPMSTVILANEHGIVNH